MPLIDDFCYARRGKITHNVFQQELNILQPIDIRNNQYDRCLLLLHGFSSSPAVFRELLSSLTQYDAIVCPVLPGHADSIASFADVKAHEWVSAAELACKSLLSEYHTVDVMGLSLGGLLACHLSHQFPINHLYLLAPALKLRTNNTLMRYTAHIARYLGFKSIRNHAGDLYTDTHSELTYRKLPLSAVIEILTLIHQSTFSPPKCPSDIFLGYFDKVVDSEAVATYFEGLPNCHVHWLKKSAHILPLDGDVDTILACVKNNNQQFL